MLNNVCTQKNMHCHIKFNKPTLIGKITTAIIMKAYLKTGKIKNPFFRLALERTDVEIGSVVYYSPITIIVYHTLAINYKRRIL